MSTERTLTDLTPAEVESMKESLGNPDAATQVTETVKEPKPVDPIESLKERMEKLEKELETREKRLKEQEKMIGKQSNEIGNLRKQVAPKEPPKIEKPSTTDWLADPAASIDKVLEYKKAQEEWARAKAEEEAHERMAQNHATITSHLPDFENHLSDIEEMLVKEDKLSRDEVKKALANPYLLDPVTMIQLAKRAVLYKDHTSLREENEKLKGKPKEIINDIKNAAKQATSVASASGAAPTKRDYTTQELLKMSRADLERLKERIS